MQAKCTELLKDLTTSYKCLFMRFKSQWVALICSDNSPALCMPSGTDHPIDMTTPFVNYRYSESWLVLATKLLGYG